MRSIREKITICLMATVLITQITVGTFSILMNYRNTVATVDRMMSETAELAAERIEQELTAYRNVAMDTGCIPQLSEWSATTETKQAILNERVRMHNFQRGNIIGVDGYSIFDGKDYSDREYVQLSTVVCAAGPEGERLCLGTPGQQDHRGAVHYGRGPHP